jgi:general secretion pathway protein L
MVEKVLVHSADVLRVLELSFRKFSTWWLRELQVLCPRLTLSPTRDKQSVLMIAPTLDAISCHLNVGTSEQRTQYRADSLSDAALDQWLAEAGTTRERTTVGLGLDQALFFVRDVELPRAALPALQRILDQELVRRTPFDPSSVWHCGTEYGSRTSADVVDVRHWIVRRDRVDTVLRQAGLSANAVDFLAVTDGSGDTLATIPMRPTTAAEPVWVRRAIQLLALLAIVVFASCLGLIGSVQSRTADRLDEELAAARQSIGMAKSGALSRLLLQKSEASVAMVWAELSQLLPDDTYLADLRIADGKILLAGVSPDAPGLVKLIGRSQLFEQVSLVGAIVPAAGEGKDQFRISCVLRQGRADARPRAPAPTRGS